MPVARRRLHGTPLRLLGPPRIGGLGVRQSWPDRARAGRMAARCQRGGSGSPHGTPRV